MNRLVPFEILAALRFLREGRLQTLLIVIGVAIGVAVIFFMSQLLSGMQANLVRRVLSAQAPVVILPPEEIARPQRIEAGVTVLSTVQRPAQRLRSIDQWQKLRDRLGEVPGIVAISPQASGPGFAVRGAANKSVTIMGIDPERYFQVVALPSKITAGSIRLTSRHAVIGGELASDLGVGVGDKIRLQTASGRAEILIVSALFDLGNKAVNQRYVYVALRTAQALLDLIGGVSSMDVVLDDAFQADSFAERISAASGLQVDSWIRTNAQLFTAVNAQTLANTVIRLFVGLSIAFGIASVLAVSVVQRSREIGILRAMGTTRRQVLGVFLAQGAMVGLAGSLVGSIAGVGGIEIWLAAVRNADGTPLIPVTIEPAILATTIGMAVATGLLAAVMPAMRAARLDPVVAIRG